jgi:site-specific DNA-cytosine methylase
MGIMKWDEAGKTVTSASIYSGTAAVADPKIPKENENGVWIIISMDGTWHRPLTTLELAVLQGLPTHIEGQPLKLAGKSDSDWRERIGNMVPVQAAQAIGETMLRAMLPQLKNEFTLGWTPIWVRPGISI